MSAPRFFLPFVPIENVLGVPYVGAQLNFYLSGSDTRAVTYSDPNLADPNDNPVISLSNGLFPNIFLDPTVNYKVVAETPTGVELWTADPYDGSVGTVATYAALRSSMPNATFVYVAGRLTAADGGQGWFYLDPTDTTSSDNDGTILVSGTARFKRLYNGANFPEWFGAGPSPIDSTNALNACGALGGLMQLAAYTYDYTGLSFQVPIRVTGAAQSTDDGAPVTVLNCTSASAADKIVVGNGATQIDGCQFEQLTFTAPNATGGAVIAFSFCADSGVRDSQMFNLGNTAIGIKSGAFNAFKVHRVRINYPTTSGVYLWSTTQRSDDCNLVEVIVRGDSDAAGDFLCNAIEIDGWVNTVVGRHVNCVAPGRGLYKHNTIGAAHGPEFVTMDDFECDFAQYHGILIDAGDGDYFTNTYLQGTLTGPNLQINYNATFHTGDVSYFGGKIANSRISPNVVINGTGVRILGTNISGGGILAPGTVPGVQLGSHSVDVVLVGNNIGTINSLVGATQTYGVQIDAGAGFYTIVGNNMEGNVNGTFLDNSGAANVSSAVTAGNLGGITAESNGSTVPVNGFAYDLSYGGSHAYANFAMYPAGALAAGTITLALNPYNTQKQTIFTSQAIAAFTLAPGAGDAVNQPVTALAANQTVTYIYNLANKVWVRFQ